MEKIATLFKEYEIVKKDGHHEFQVFGKEIQDHFKLPKFPIQLFLRYNHQKIKDAFQIAKKKGCDYPYFVGIIRNLK